MKYILPILLLAIVYFLAGRVGLAFAIPPVYASPLFPAAGIAAAILLAKSYRLAPGVFLGSLFLHLYISFQTRGNESYYEIVALCCVIALGAMAQAMISKFLVERTIGINNPIATIQSIVNFFFYAAVVSCVVSSFVASCALYISGAIKLSHFFSTWFYWWLGDAFGVTVFAPIVLSFFSRPNINWINRRLYISIALVLTLSVSVIVFFGAQKWYAEKNKLAFEARAALYFKQIEESIDSSISFLHSIERFYSASENISRSEFSIFTKTILEERSEIQALEWIPKVEYNQVKFYENLAKKDGLKQFKIWNKDEDQARKAGALYPVYYIEPLKGNESVLGFNLGSSISRFEALEQSAAMGRAVLTEKVSLIQDGTSQGGILIYYPVYQYGIVPQSQSDNFKYLKGFALGVLKISEFVSNSLGKEQINDLEIMIEDVDKDGRHTLLFSSFTESSLQPFELLVAQEVKLGERRWLVHLRPGVNYNTYSSLLPMWAIFVFGLAMSSIIGAFLLHVTGRNIIFSQLLDQRTLELRETNTQLLHATTVKSQFLAHMSHEIRTPMNGIIGMAQMLLKRAVDRRTVDTVRDILNSAKDLLAIINDILDVSKVESNKITLEIIPFRVSEIVSSLEILFRESAEQKGIELFLCLEPDFPQQLIGDPMRLKQVLINLIGNAIKFTQSGDITLSLKHHFISSNMVEVLFVVKDTGIGIHAEKIPTLFQSFSQTDTSISRHFGGTGLGLYLSQKLVQLMGGNIEVESIVGKGSVFSFSLNFEVTTAPIAANRFISDQVSKDLSLEDLNIYPIRIMFAEDVETNRKLGEMIFSHLGYDVTFAKDGEEVLHHFESSDFDLIFMDMQMPVVNGIEATKKIRATPSRKQPYIVALTANAYSEDRERCLESGMDDFLSKPFEIAKIAELIKKVALQNDFKAISKQLSTASSDSLPSCRFVDCAQVHELYSLNPKLFHELYLLFVSKYGPFVADLRQAIDEKDLDAFNRCTHAFKGVCLNIGATQLGLKFSSITSFDQISDFETMVKELEEIFDQTKKEMEAVLNS